MLADRPHPLAHNHAIGFGHEWELAGAQVVFSNELFDAQPFRRFEGKDGTGTQTVAEVGPDRVVYAIDLGPMGQPRQSLTARPVAGGTEVVWRMEAEMGANPVFRVFGLFMDRMMGKTFEQGLRNLADATA